MIQYESTVRKKHGRVRMVKIYDNSSNRLLGEINEPQLQVLIDQLEEESGDDQDYFLNRDTLDLLTKGGADQHTLAILEMAMKESGQGEIRWVRE
jgi:hypothetical protein